MQSLPNLPTMVFLCILFTANAVGAEPGAVSVNIGNVPDKQQNEYAKKVAARMNALWLADGKPYLPGVLVHAFDGKYSVAVENEIPGIRDRTPESVNLARKALKRLPAPQKTTDVLCEFFKKMPASQQATAQDQTDDRCRTYINQLERRVCQFFHAPKLNQTAYSTVEFNVDKAGQMRNLHIVNPSFYAPIDDQALQAVREAAPFKPLPAAATDQMSIQLNFGSFYIDDPILLVEVDDPQRVGLAERKMLMESHTFAPAIAIEQR